ncbi:unnamed protein product [Xylocopa violacea]|uniref:Uncharacterized protein n=1 Tax=Xylocopa violacea TaxID=135666 RepID=A0ABP1NI78_XYLVO
MSESDSRVLTGASRAAKVFRCFKKESRYPFTNGWSRVKFIFFFTRLLPLDSPVRQQISVICNSIHNVTSLWTFMRIYLRTRRRFKRGKKRWMHMLCKNIRKFYIVSLALSITKRLVRINIRSLVNESSDIDHGYLTCIGTRLRRAFPKDTYNYTSNRETIYLILRDVHILYTDYVRYIVFTHAETRTCRARVHVINS